MSLAASAAQTFFLVRQITQWAPVWAYVGTALTVIILIGTMRWAKRLSAPFWPCVAALLGVAAGLVATIITYLLSSSNLAADLRLLVRLSGTDLAFFGMLSLWSFVTCSWLNGIALWWLARLCGRPLNQTG